MKPLWTFISGVQKGFAVERDAHAPFTRRGRRIEAVMTAGRTPEVTPEVTPDVTPDVTREVAPEVTPPGTPPVGDVARFLGPFEEGVAENRERQTYRLTTRGAALLTQLDEDLRSP